MSAMTSTSADQAQETHVYCVHCLDDLSVGMQDSENGTRFGGSTKRMANYSNHKAYLGTTQDPSLPTYMKKIAAGPLESEDGKYMIGSMFLLEGTREQVEKFHINDPFYKAGVWEKVSITRWMSPIGIAAATVETVNSDPTTMKLVVAPK